MKSEYHVLLVPVGLGMLSSMPAGIGIWEKIMVDIEAWRTSEKTIKKVRGTTLILIIVRILQSAGIIFLTRKIFVNTAFILLSTIPKI